MNKGRKILKRGKMEDFYWQIFYLKDVQICHLVIQKKNSDL